MSQFARPISDVSSSVWYPSPWTADIYPAIDEVSANDTDFALLEEGSGASFTVQLGELSDPGINTGHVLRFRHRRDGVYPAGISAKLYQGETQIAALSSFASGGSWTTTEFAISESDAAAITDYTNLRAYILGSTPSGSNLLVSWIELEVPDAASSAVVSIIHQQHLGA